MLAKEWAVLWKQIILKMMKKDRLCERSLPAVFLPPAILNVEYVNLFIMHSISWLLSLGKPFDEGNSWQILFQVSSIKKTSFLFSVVMISLHLDASSSWSKRQPHAHL